MSFKRALILGAALGGLAMLPACSKPPAEPAAEQSEPAPESVQTATATDQGAQALPPQAPDGAAAAIVGLADAKPLALGEAVAADIPTTETHHFYKIDNALKARDRVTLRFENLSATLKPDVKIYDANRSQLAEKYDGTAGASLDYEFTIEPGQTIYVEVLPYGSTGRYRLTLTPKVAYDSFEPNADALSAAAVKVGATIEANILDEKDEDWFRISGATSKTLSVVLENQSVTLKPDIKVYNSNKSNLLEKYDGTPGANLDFQIPAEPGKDVYIQVLPYSSAGKYKLTVK
jgi:hypothetical protein